MIAAGIVMLIALLAAAVPAQGAALALVLAFCVLSAAEVGYMPGSGATVGDLADQTAAALVRVPVFLVTGVTALVTAVIVLNAAGRAPEAARADWYAKKGIARIETTSVHAVTVPGAVDGWCRLCEDHGSMPLARLLGPAIALAEQGFAVAPRVSVDWARAAAKLGRQPAAARHFLPTGRPPRVGEVMRFPALAATLKLIAKEGRAGFYAGEVARDMVATLRQLGGLHTLEDFAAQAASYVEPI